MKLKVKDLLEARSALRTLGGISLSAKASYIVARNTRKVVPELEMVEETRLGILKKYEATTKDGEVSFPSEASKKQADEEFEDLVRTEIEVDIREITIADFGNSLVPPFVLENLWWMIKEE